MKIRLSVTRTALLVSALLLISAGSVRADVTIHCLAVGQADATLIRSSSGQTLLFDGGDNGSGDDVVIPYLQALGVGPLTHMAASHYHADHIGGLDEVYDVIGVSGNVYDRGWSYTTATYSSYAATVAPKRTTITDGQVIDLGDGVTVTCLALNGNGELSSPYTNSSYENEYCLALLVECGDFDFFVAGDLTGGYGSYEDIETSLAVETGDIEVYHVSHHGSYSSSNSYFMGQTTPEVSIISVPDDSPYGHPHQDTLDRLYAVGTYVYQTARGSDSTYPASMRTIVDGHIVISTIGFGSYTVNGDIYEMDEDYLDVPSNGAFALLGNHPNPFNPATNILFETLDGGPASLTIYDLGGRRLFGTRFDAAPGRSSIRWNGRDDEGRGAASGVYIYRLGTREGSATGRMMLTR